MGSKKKAAKTLPLSDDACGFCMLELEDEYFLGKKFKKDGLTAHYYCLLFACGLRQNGEETEGILGFMTADIRREISRARKLRCSFCKLKGAATACFLEKCRVMYHFPCGILNNTLNQFFGTFPSFCKKHRPMLADARRFEKELKDENCYICLDKLLTSENASLHFQITERKVQVDKDAEGYRFRLLFAECCCKWLHVKCIQEQAYNAGVYFVKCPLCNDRSSFKSGIIDQGVYVPDKDASWEDMLTFRDLEVRYEKCDALECKCPKGREHCEDLGDWVVMVCTSCGSAGVHSGCLPIEELEKLPVKLECDENPQDLSNHSTDVVDQPDVNASDLLLNPSSPNNKSDQESDDDPVVVAYDWVCEFCKNVENNLTKRKALQQTKPEQQNELVQFAQLAQPVQLAQEEEAVMQIPNTLEGMSLILRPEQAASNMAVLSQAAAHILLNETRAANMALSNEEQRVIIDSQDEPDKIISEDEANRKRSRSPIIGNLLDENLPFRKRRHRIRDPTLSIQSLIDADEQIRASNGDPLGEILNQPVASSSNNENRSNEQNSSTGPGESKNSS